MHLERELIEQFLLIKSCNTRYEISDFYIVLIYCMKGRELTTKWIGRVELTSQTTIPEFCTDNYPGSFCYFSIPKYRRKHILREIKELSFLYHFIKTFEMFGDFDRFMEVKVISVPTTYSIRIYSVKSQSL